MLLSFEEFASQLPKCATKFDSKVEWAEYPSGNPYFLAPRLELSDGAADAPVILVSASGAIGKTTFAKGLANHQQAPVIDLAKRRVGTDAFLGLLGNAFGFERVSEVYRGLKEGKFLLLLDALDETRVGSGQENFEGFLLDLVRHFRDQKSSPVLILFARVETADLIQIVLEEQGVAYKRYAIAPFSPEDAREFIDRFLDAKSSENKKAAMHRNHRLPFETARDGLLDAVRKSAPPSEGDQLLGYAPVLVTLGTLLYDVPNFQVIDSLLQKYGHKDAWGLLAMLAEDLLQREQRDKFRPQLPAAIRDTVPDALSPDEQCLWLLLDYAGLQPAQSAPSAVPSELLSAYKRAVESQMAEHPFRKDRGFFANSVFRDYVVGWYLARFPKDRGTASADIRAALLSKKEFLPTPLLARFAEGLAGSDGDSSLTIEAQNVGFVYESLVAQSDSAKRAWIFMDSSNGAGALSATAGVGDDPFNSLTMSLVGAEEGIWFWRRLQWAGVAVDCPVELGAQAGEFLLGPGVEIRCSELACPAQFLEVRAEDEDAAVAIEASRCREPAQPNLRVRGKFFFVRWPQMAHPWVRYLARVEEQAPTDAALIEACTHLSRILGRLRGGGYGSVARHRDIVRNFATGGTSTGKAMLDFCMREGVIVPDGELLTLSDQRAAQFGINWNDLRLRRLNGQLRTFLSRFVREAGSAASVAG